MLRIKITDYLITVPIDRYIQIWYLVMTVYVLAYVVIKVSIQHALTVSCEWTKSVGNSILPALGRPHSCLLYPYVHKIWDSMVITDQLNWTFMIK